MMLIKTEDQLSKMKVSELKEYAKLNGLKGYSTLNKINLVSFIKNNIETFGEPIVYVFNENLNMFSITALDYINLSIKDMVSLLKEHVSGKMFSNQAMNEKEVKALYRAGFRVRGQETLSERETLELYNKTHSVHMVANTTIYNIIEVVEVGSKTIEQTKTNNDSIESKEVNKQETHTVGNKAFITHDEAVQYCNDNDYIPELMIQYNKQDNQEESNKNLYWYAYRLRGFSPFCQPKGHIDHKENVGRHGIIAYDRQLTKYELEEYELSPYSFNQEMTG